MHKRAAELSISQDQTEDRQQKDFLETEFFSSAILLFIAKTRFGAKRKSIFLLHENVFNGFSKKMVGLT
jgi:hypothetical protein